MRIVTFFNLAGLLTLACGATAGEPIRFSGRTGPVQELALERRAPFIPTEASSDRNVMRTDQATDGLFHATQSVTPTTGLTRKQLEAQEQRRNFLLQTPEALLLPSSDRVGRADDETVKDDGRAKAAGERVHADRESRGPLEERNRSELMQKPARDRNIQRHPSEANGGLKPGEGSVGFEARTGGLGRGAEPGGLAAFSDVRGGFVSRAVSEAKDRERQRERDASLDAFKQTFNNPWTQNALVGGAPSLSAGNSLPLAPGVLGNDVRRGSSGLGLAPSSRSGLDLGPRSSGFDPQNPLNYGASETVLKNNEAPRAAPKPVVLEIPKRKF